MRRQICVVLGATMLLCSCAAGVTTEETTQAPDVGGTAPPAPTTEPALTPAENAGNVGGKWVGGLRDVEERTDGVIALSASRTIGVFGGVVDLGREAKLTIPRGALRSDEVITVTRVPRPAGGTLGAYVGHTFAIEPAGLVLRKSATLNIHLPAEPPPTVIGVWAGDRTTAWVLGREAVVQGSRLGEVGLFAPEPPNREPVLGWPDVLPPPE